MLPSRIWDRVLFLFSDYPNLQLVRMRLKYEVGGLKKRKPEIWDRRKCEDSRGVENACSAFLLAPTSHFLLSQIFGFLFFGSRWKLVFKSWMGIRGLPRRLWFSLEWISLEEDTFLLDCIKIIFTYSYLMEDFSLVNSHNLLENPLLFPTQNH